MAMPCFVKVEGTKQGAIDGACDIKGHEKMILAFSVDHEVSMPTDAHSNQTTGKAIHCPVEIVKEVGPDSPKLYQAMCSGEHLKNVEIQYYRITPEGKEEHYYTQALSGAVVVSMKPFVPMTFLEENQGYRHMEKVGFSYSTIKWTWVPDGIESQHSWKGE